MSALYSFTRGLLNVWVKINGMRILGQEHINSNQAQLVVSNHVSYGDPPLVAIAFPQKITFIAKGTFAKNPITNKLFSALGAVFLSPESNDFTALRTVIKLLKAGKIVAIFPEGTRHLNQELGEFKSGAAYIAAKAKVSVLPVAVVNCGDFWRFWKRNIIVNIGAPIITEPPEKIDDCYLASQTMLYHEKISELLAESTAILSREGRPMRKHK